MGSTLWTIVPSFNAKVLFLYFCLIGISMIIIGFLTRKNQSRLNKYKKINRNVKLYKLLKKIDKASNSGILISLKHQLSSGLSLYIEKGELLSGIATLILLFSLISGVVIGGFLSIFGMIWYSKLLLFLIGCILPYYISTLLLDFIKMKLTRNIPIFFDEFRSAFSSGGKLIPALIESSQNVDRNLSKIIYKAAGSSNPIEEMKGLKNRINNIWFGIFVTMLDNYKNNGGELLSQLYRLNRTMTRQINIDKKKNKRLLFYELFAVTVAIFGVPVCLYLNSIFIGNSYSLNTVESSMLMVKLSIYCIGALVITRLLRKS
jgi:hypothetical protein